MIHYRRSRISIKNERIIRDVRTTTWEMDVSSILKDFIRDKLLFLLFFLNYPFVIKISILQQLFWIQKYSNKGTILFSYTFNYSLYTFLRNAHFLFRMMSISKIYQEILNFYSLINIEYSYCTIFNKNKILCRFLESDNMKEMIELEN